MDLFVGLGFDIHPFRDGRKLVLGGVEIPYHKGLLGHSDADVLVHAICDAILGAARKGDLGTHFSDKDPKWKGVYSLVLLAEVEKMIREEGLFIKQIDTVILAQEPRLSPYIEEMRENIAKNSHTNKEMVSIKITSPEGIGCFGRGEGMGAWAVVLLERRDPKLNR